MKILLSLCLLFTAFLPIPFAHAQPFDTCTESGVDEAIRRGGTTVFDCPAPIYLYFSKIITQDVTLVGVGDGVILDGQDEVATQFLVSEGATLSLHNVQLLNSQNIGVRVRVDSTLYVTDSQFAWHGSPDNSSAAIYNEGGRVYVENSVFERTENDAAIVNEQDSDLEISGSTFRLNTARSATATGIRNSGTALIQGSYFYDNWATESRAAAVANFGDLTVISSHFYNNDAGIFNAADATAAVVDSSLTNNTSETDGRGIFNEGTLTLSTSYVQFNPQNCEGAVISAGGNFQSDDASCGNEIEVSSEPYRTFDTLVTAFSYRDVTLENDGTYSAALSWAVYTAPITEFRVVIAPLIYANAPTMIVPTSSDTPEMGSTRVRGLTCGLDYVAVVEGLSNDGRTVLGRSYPIAIVTPACG